jgi:uncharacterized cupin superfamily protein
MTSEPEPTRSAATAEFGRTELQSVQSLAEIPGDVASWRHSHTDPEVGYIVRGDVAIECDDGATPTLRSGDPVLIPPGVIRNARNIGSVTTKDAFHLRGMRGATPRDQLQLKARFRDSGWDRDIPMLCGRKTYNAPSREDPLCFRASSGSVSKRKERASTPFAGLRNRRFCCCSASARRRSRCGTSSPLGSPK